MRLGDLPKAPQLINGRTRMQTQSLAPETLPTEIINVEKHTHTHIQIHTTLAQTHAHTGHVPTYLATNSHTCKHIHKYG